MMSSSHGGWRHFRMKAIKIHWKLSSSIAWSPNSHKSNELKFYESKNLFSVVSDSGEKEKKSEKLIRISMMLFCILYLPLLLLHERILNISISRFDINPQTMSLLFKLNALSHTSSDRVDVSPVRSWQVTILL